MGSGPVQSTFAVTQTPRISLNIVNDHTTLDDIFRITQPKP